MSSDRRTWQLEQVSKFTAEFKRIHQHLALFTDQCKLTVFDMSDEADTLINALLDDMLNLITLLERDPNLLIRDTPPSLDTLKRTLKPVDRFGSFISH